MINNKMISGPIPGGVFANRLGADIMVGARPAASPLFAAVSLAGDLPFAFVREAGYVGHALSPAALGFAAGRPRASCRVDDSLVDDLTEACLRLLGVGATNARRLAGVLSPAAETARRSARPRD